MTSTTSAVLYRRGDNYVYHLAVGEHLLVSLHAHRHEPLYALTPTGALLWEALSEWSSRDQLADRLVAEYDIDREKALADVQEFLEQLELLKALEPTGNDR